MLFSRHGRSVRLAALAALLTASYSLPADAQSRTYLSDINWTSATSGWGPPERNRSNGELGAADGRTLTLNGATYGKGLGLHSYSDVRYALNRNCSTFSAVVGLDDEVGNNGTVAFEVWTDGARRFSSGVMNGSMAGRAVSVDVSGASELALVVTNGDGSSYADHADWADAQVVCGSTNANIEVSPGQSLQAAIDAVPQGATILIKSGVHRMQTASPKTNQTLVGESGAVLSGAKLLTSFSRSGSYWVASGQTQQGPANGSANDQVCRASSPMCGYPDDVFIDNIPLEHVASLSLVAPGRWYFDYNADRIYLADDPAGRTVEAAVTTTALGGYATGVTLSNLIVEKYATPTSQGAVSLGAGWVIQDSTVRWNHYGGVATGTGSTVRRTVVHQNGGVGIFGAGENILAEGNEISYNGFAGYNPYWGAGGTKWVLTRNLVVRGNFSHHNMGAGLWTDINNIYVLYENNTMEDNERSGIFHELGYDATIRYNTARRNGTERVLEVVDLGAGIEIYTSPNVEVYGNVVEDNWNGITGLNDPDEVQGLYGQFLLTNFNVHDNTIVSHATEVGIGRTGITDTANGPAFAPQANNRFRNNRYVLGTKEDYFMWLGAEVNEYEWRSFGQDTGGSFQR